jgi:hypothetical protein
VLDVQRGIGYSALHLLPVWCWVGYLVVAVCGESDVQHVEGLHGSYLQGSRRLLDDLRQHVLDRGEVGVHSEVSVTE